MYMQKISLTAIVALALCACSDEMVNAPSEYSDAVDGGSVLANGKDPTKGSPNDSAASNDSLAYTVYRNVKIVSNAYPDISVYELDSTSLSSVRQVYRSMVSYNTDETVIDSLSLNGPYILIEDCCFSTKPYRSIADVRQPNQLVVNLKTHLESFRLAHLVETGMDFATAKAQAGAEVLEAFGYYGDPSLADDFENVRSAKYKAYLEFVEELLDREMKMDSAVAKIAQCGSLDCDDEAQKLSLVRAASNLFKYYHKVGKNVNYLADFLALYSGQGHCTSAVQDSVFEIPGENILLTCRNDKWSAAYKSMDFTVGTMTDARDGKTYKTVTYDMNGNPVTWMAEDLSYRDPSAQAPCENCNYYYFDEALKLNDAAVQSVETCVAAEFDDCPNCVWRDTVEIWSNCRLYPYSRIDYPKLKSYADSVLAANGAFQGVCPEGWHLPQRSEWETLLDYFKNFYYPNVEDDWPGQGHDLISKFLFERGDVNPSGFGLVHYEINSDDGRYYDWNKYFVVYDKYGFGVLIDNGGVDLYSAAGRYTWEAPAVELVRCVKN